eukprot:scaffold41228_cov50-Phaeocystis_antarctica.AAC.5
MDKMELGEKLSARAVLIGVRIDGLLGWVDWGLGWDERGVDFEGERRRRESGLRLCERGERMKHICDEVVEPKLVALDKIDLESPTRRD